MQTVLVVNSKGGSGKTTVATNIASYYAHNKHVTALMDYDPQGSSLQWLKLRKHTQMQIHGANAAKQKGGKLRCWQMKIPSNTAHLIIDAPAGIDGLLLQEMVRAADSIVIPVAPSAIDIHATADFIRDLYLIGKVRPNRARVAVIANRVRNGVPVYKPLEKFLNSLNIPFVAVLTDSEKYIQAVGEGVGVVEMEPDETRAERLELGALFNWLNKARNKTILASTGPISELISEPTVIDCRDKFTNTSPINSISLDTGPRY